MDSYEIKHLRKVADYHMSFQLFFEFIKSRLEMMMSGKDGPTALGYEFDAGAWVKFDVNDPEHLELFFKFCSLGETRNGFSILYLPRMIPQIDPSGEAVAQFIKSYLEKYNPDSVQLHHLASLISYYETDSMEFNQAASILLDYKGHKQSSRKDRYSLFRTLRGNKIETYTSAIGEVPSLFIDNERKKLEALHNEPKDSPLYEFRQFQYDCAAEELETHKAWAREDMNWDV